MCIRDSDSFVSEYEALVDTAKKYQPDADIYLLSVTPVSAEVSDKAEDGLTNDNIVEINKLIKEVAEDKDVIYCDIFSAVANSKGELPASAASDGIHFDRSYYEKCRISVSYTHLVLYFQTSFLQEKYQADAFYRL